MHGQISPLCQIMVYSRRNLLIPQPQEHLQFLTSETFPLGVNPGPSNDLPFDDLPI